MAGLLSANPRFYDEGGTGITIEPSAICAVSLLGPVEAANNVLLYAAVCLSSGADPAEVTLQWHRCSVDLDGATDSIGTAVGDAWVIQLGDTELSQPFALIMAVDSANTVTSAYALVGVVDPEMTITVLVGDADALTFD